MLGMFLSGFLFLLTHISLDLLPYVVQKHTLGEVGNGIVI